jgi:nitrite reductase/ring-hydroxylating ferredoxin subunit
LKEEKPKEYDFHRIMEAGFHGADFIKERHVRKVLALDRYIAMTKIDGQLYALKGKCPHSGGPMYDGYIDAQCNIVCPLHRFTFSVKDGKNTSGEGFWLENYPVEIRDGAVYVGFIRRRFLGIF